MHFELPNGQRAIQFDGELLGASSSEGGGKRRWAEISIYRTGAGKYVVAGVGRTTVEGESDRAWVKVASDADGAVNALRMRDDRQIVYVPKVSMQALEAAALLDADLARSLQSELV